MYLCSSTHTKAFKTLRLTVSHLRSWPLLFQVPLSERKHTLEILRYATLTARLITFHF